MYKIGFSNTSNVIDDAFFKGCHDAGIELVEISFAWDKDYDNLDFKNLKKLSDFYGVKLWTLHLPFYPYERTDVSSLNLMERKTAIDYHTQLIKKGVEISIDKFVIHPSNEPIADDERDEKLKSSMEGLAQLAENASEFGAVIAVEDLPRSCLGRNSDEILKLISGHDNLRVCFDTNHILNEDIVDFVHKVGKKIITTHISDYDYIDERHWLPGEGKINWHKLYDSLRKIDYCGEWIYELALTNTKNIKRSRNLEYSDLVKNAKEIFENRELTIIK